MKKLQILLPMAAVLLSLTGCKKDNEKSGPSGETVTLSATLGGGEKTEIYNETKMRWSEGDEVNINGTTRTAKFNLGHETAFFENVASADEYEAIYPASLYKGGTTYELPPTQTYHPENGNKLSDISPMYAVTKNTELQFHHIFALVKLEVTGTGTVKQIVVTSSSHDLRGTFTVSESEGKFWAEIANGERSVTLDCGEDGVALNATIPTTFYIALPQGNDIKNLTFKCCGDDGVWASQPIANANLTAGKLYTKSLKNVEMKPGFSVADGETVEFAPGNLWYDGSAFHFETNQWDYCVNYHQDEWGYWIYGWNPSHVSHFYWSKDAKEAVKEEYEDNEVSTEDSFFTNATETTANTSFHVNGETGTNQWRTLSRDEWSYLLNSRTDANRFAKAKVNGVLGLLIFPDGYTLPDGYTTAAGGTGMAKVNKTSSSDAPWPDLDIPTEKWTLMESSGAVFLPAAGYRDGTGVDDVGSVGYYCSSTPLGPDGAFGMWFASHYVGPRNDDRSSGYAVRLVR